MATQLLDDDGTASMATALMSSHFAFHRDLACIAAALNDPTRAAAVQAAWTKYRQTLHAHHTIEETSMFPDLRAKHPALASALDELDRHHRAIDPLLERGDAAFANLDAHRTHARATVDALRALLEEHLAAEELAVIPHLRGAKEFPLPPGDEAVSAYAEGFAWSLAGIADSVVEAVQAMLPPAVVAKLPAARAAFDEHCQRTWGYTHPRVSTLSVPGAR